MLVRGAALKETMSSYLSTRILSHPKIHVRLNSEVSELDGDGALETIGIKDRRSGNVERVPASRLFVAIGGVPNTEWAKDTPIIRNSAGFLSPALTSCETALAEGLAAEASALSSGDLRPWLVRGRRRQAQLGEARRHRRRRRRHGGRFRASPSGGQRVKRSGNRAWRLQL